MAETQHTYSRAVTAAMLGGITQVALSILVAITALYAQSEAVTAATWYFFAGIPIWVALWGVLLVHRQERAEALEAAELSASDAEAARMFDEAGQQLAIARQRLDAFYKWGLNVVTVFVAFFLGIAGGMLLWGHWRQFEAGQLQEQPLAEGVTIGLLVLLLIVPALVAFLVSRYVAGMTTVREWSILRSGASFLMGNAVVAALLVVASGIAAFGNPIGFTVLALLIPAFMVLLSVEMLLGLLFSIYRPRARGEAVRPAFESRILGFFARPESIGAIVSETLNYQFGFEISKSWFYQLLGKAAMPLLLAGLLILLALSCVVIVGPQQNAIITTNGRLVRVAEPGLTFKYPWPFGGAEMIDRYRVQEILVSSRTLGDDQHFGDTAMLWTNDHGTGEETFFLTAPGKRGDRGSGTGDRDTAGSDLGKPSLTTTDSQASEDDEEGNASNPIPDPRSPIPGRSTAGELIGADVVITYRIADPEAYARSAQNPDRVLRMLADATVNAYFASHTVDELLGAGRVEAGTAIRERLAEQVDEANLGLRVVAALVSGVHPPQTSDVATKFHEVVGALQEKEASIQRAQGEAVSTLATVAGSAEAARALSDAIQQLETMRDQDADDDAIQQQRLEITQMLQDAGGEAGQLLQQARAYRWQRAIGTLAEAERFESERQAYDAAPAYYRQRAYLDMLADTLATRRKLILETAEGSKDPTVRLDLKQQGSGLDTILWGASELCNIRCDPDH